MAKHPTGYCPVFGNYPKEYNRVVHGPYYPWVNYGPKDTPLNQVKLGEFKDWFARRNKTPQAAMAAFSRTFYLWRRDWFEVRHNASKAWIQLSVVMSLTSFLASFGYYKHERNHKYHW